VAAVPSDDSRGVPAPVASTVPRTDPFDRGVAGRSALAEYERRHATYEERMQQRFGRLARVARLFGAEPQSTTAWATGAAGERRVGAYLDGAIPPPGVVLHDRRIPGTRENIDHLVIVHSGVWVVDAKHYAGRVERRDVGGWFRSDVRLFVGRRDRSKAVSGVGRQLGVVERALADASVPLHGVLCFVGADWRWFAKPFQIDGIWVTWPTRLGTMMAVRGPLDIARIRGTAAHLAQRLLPA